MHFQLTARHGQYLESIDREDSTPFPILDCGNFKRCTQCLAITCLNCVSEMDCHSCGIDTASCALAVQMIGEVVKNAIQVTALIVATPMCML